MSLYSVQVSYTPEAWATLIKKPQDRVKTVGHAAEKLGGKVVGSWMTFGDYDIMVILDMPDQVAAAAFAVAVAAGGACKSVKTTPLLSIEQGIEAMKKASSTGYEPPR